MSGPDLRLREGVPGAERTLDPAFGMEVAGRWLAHHGPGGRLVSTRTHTALCRAVDDVSVRVSAELDTREGGGREADGDLTLLVRSRSGTVTTTAFPDDPALPTLAAMLDAPVAAGVLEAAAPMLSEALSPGHRLRTRVTVVHHPRTGACVVRYDLIDPEGGPCPVVYGKIYPTPDEARAAASAVTALDAHVLHHASDPPVRVPRLLGVDLAHHAVFLEALPTVDSPHEGVRPAEAARVLRALHSTVPVQPLPNVSTTDETGRARQEVRASAAVWPDLAAILEPHVETAAQVLTGSPEPAAVLCHGDFTPSQLVRVPGGIGLLDLDTLRMADPSSDAGRYLAYAELANARRSAAGAGRLAADPDPDGALVRVPFCTAYLDDAPADQSAQRGPWLERVEAYRSLHLAQVAVRAARRFKEPRVHLALALLDTTHPINGGRDDRIDR